MQNYDVEDVDKTLVIDQTSSERLKEEDWFEKYIHVKCLVYFLYKCFISKLKTGLVALVMDEERWWTQTSGDRSLNDAKVVKQKLDYRLTKYHICQQSYARKTDIQLGTMIKLYDFP